MSAHEDTAVLLRAEVEKDFDGVAFRGEVTAIDAQTGWLTVRYSDGDEEELTPAEIGPLLVDRDLQGQPAATPGWPYIPHYASSAWFGPCCDSCCCCCRYCYCIRHHRSNDPFRGRKCCRRRRTRLGWRPGRLPLILTLPRRRRRILPAALAGGGRLG